jgi:hypothetical protein
MKHSTLLKKNILYFAILAAFFLAIPTMVSAADVQENGVTSSTELQLIEGQVKLFNPETLSVVVKLKNGDKVTVWLDWNTELVGYESTDQIDRKHKVKVWYTDDNGTLKAVKFEKKLKVGC